MITNDRSAIQRPVDAAEEGDLFSLVDGKALLGAVALWITGFILTVMLYQYLMAAEGFRVLTRSRFWWEVALNLQVLSVAFIWFCYSDRIDGSSGQVKILQRIRLWFALVTVLLPSILGLMGIRNNWFVVQPSAEAITAFAYCVLAYWLLGLWLNYLVMKKRNTILRRVSLWHRAAFLGPAIILALITLIDAPGGGDLWILAIPFLTYFQGSMPFISKAFGWR